MSSILKSRISFCPIQLKLWGKGIRYIFIFLSIFFVAFQSHATVYYMATAANGGSNSNDGSIGSPWLTLKYALSQATTPGDTVFVTAGTYLETEQITWPVGVSIMGEGETSVIVSHVTGATEDTGPLLFTGNSPQGTNGNQSISYLKFDGDNLTGYSVLRTVNRNNVSVHHCTIVDFEYKGVDFDTSGSAGTYYSTGNSFHDNVTDNCGGLIGGTNARGHLELTGQEGFLCYNNYMTQNRGYGLDGFIIKAVPGYIKGLKIYDNTILRKHHDGVYYGFALEFFAGRGGNEIYNNRIAGEIDFAGIKHNDEGGYGFAWKIYDNDLGYEEYNPNNNVKDYGIQIEGMHSDGVQYEGGFYVYNNTISYVGIGFWTAFNAGWTGMEVKDIYIHNNLLKNIGYTGGNWSFGMYFTAQTGADLTWDNINIWNNTIYSPEVTNINRSGIKLELKGSGGATNINVKNNIIEGFVNDGPIHILNCSIGTINIENNNFYNNGKSNQVLIDGTATVTTLTNQNNITTIPGFVNPGTDFNLAETSNNIDAGIDVGLPYYGSAPDIGAFEFHGNTLSDVEVPVVTNFSIPETSSSLVVSISSFTASDNKAVAGYMLTESGVSPLVGDAGWTTTAPASYTFVSEGTKTLYAWAKDAAGNVSRSTSAQVFVSLPHFKTVGREESGLNQMNINIADARQEGIPLEKEDEIGVFDGDLCVGVGKLQSTIDREDENTYIQILVSERDGADNGFIAGNNISFKIWDASEKTETDINTIIFWNDRPEWTSEGKFVCGGICFAEIGFHQQKPTVYTEEDVSVCEGSSYLGWTTTGRYERTLQSNSGGDSIVVTRLKVNSVYSETAEAAICEGETYSLGSQTLSESGEYTEVFQTVHGCDSTVVLTLTVHQDYYVTEDITIVEGENYMGCSESGEYQRLLTTVSGCDSVIITQLRVEPLQNQLIDLSEGWNIFSSYLTPLKKSFDDVFENLKTNNLLIEGQDENGKTYRESHDRWINEIGEIRESEGYRIRVDSSCTLELKGQLVEFPLNIQLFHGFNIIPFPYMEEKDAMKVIQPLIDDGILEKVQDERGNSIENWGNLMGWINGIGNFIPGEGYVVEVNKDGVLSLPEEFEKSGLILSGQHDETSHFKKIFEGNGFGHMSINVTGLDVLNLKAGDEIAAFDGNLCIGAVRLSETNVSNNIASLQASASDKDLLNGFNEGNSVHLRVWLNSTELEFQVQPEVIKGNNLFQKHGSVFFQLPEKKRIETTGDSLLKVNVYPNPAQNMVTIQFSVLPETETKLILYDMTGKQITNRIVQSETEYLYIESQPSGIYFLKIVKENYCDMQKLMIH